jgi:hypothetical protein
MSEITVQSGADIVIDAPQSIINEVGGGDVTGPGSSTDHAIARWDGTGGDTLLDSVPTINDDGDLAMNGGDITADGVLTSPSSGTESEKLGATATAGDSGVAVGYGADALVNSVALGHGSTTTGSGGSVAVGEGSSANTSAIGIGKDVSAGGTSSVAMGKDAIVDAAAANGVAIGALSDCAGADGLALGVLADASLTDCTATGKLATASATNASAYGANSLASGSSSAAFGEFAEAKNANAIAVGANADAAGSASIAIGASSDAPGSNGCCCGFAAYARGSQSTAFGPFARVNTGYTRGTAVGYSTAVNGIQGTAIGANAEANHSYSGAIGNESLSTAADTITVGRVGGIGTGLKKDLQVSRDFRVSGDCDNAQEVGVKGTSVQISSLSGASATWSNAFPAGSIPIGVTMRVTTGVTGATGIDVGDGSDQDRWGANIAPALGTVSDNADWTDTTLKVQPAATDVVLTALGSSFTAGAVRLTAHYLEAVPPTS